MDQFLANFNKDDKIKTFIDADLLHHAKDCLIGAIDQGTSSSRFLVFSKLGRLVASAQMEHGQIFPEGEDKVGWHEHNPVEIWNNVAACADTVLRLLRKRGVPVDRFPLRAVGLTNQRETTVAWNAQTGVPYYNAIVWDDVRTTHIADQIADGNVHRLREKTGLPLASYFAGTKVKWLLDNVEQLRSDVTDPVMREYVRFGTIDAWLLYQLTGEKSPHKGAANVGGIFMTDVSNASRWLFLDIHKVQWDADLVDTICHPHKVPLSALPRLQPSSRVYATLSASCGINGFDLVPLAGVLGDQQAALFGQCAFEPGEAKNTYGTGLFLMMNTGTEIVPSSHGLLTTIAYQIDDTVVYALEGSVSHSGSTLQWLRDQLQIIQEFAETEQLATLHNDGLYLVPAFAGLFAPHWRSDARACIVGMTATHHRGHVCRAALEATAYQAKEVFDAIYADSKVQLKALKVDGGGTASQLLMQFQADMIGVPVVKPVVQETTAMGATFAAGLAVGIWKDLNEIRGLWQVAETWTPKMSDEEREKNWHGWQKAVSKSMGWIEEQVDEEGDEFYDVLTEDVAGATLTRGIVLDEKNEGTGHSTSFVLVVGATALAVGLLFGTRRK